MKSSNMWQAMEAMKAINAVRKSRGLEKLDEKNRKTHIYKPKGGERDARREDMKEAVEECRYCKERGHVIKRKGELTCPKLIAKEKANALKMSTTQSRTNRMKEDWSRHIDDLSGNATSGWTKTKSKRRGGVKKENPSPKIIKVRNRYDMGDSDDSDDDLEEIKLDTVKPCVPAKPKGAWATPKMGWGVKKTAEDIKETEPTPGILPLERQTATSEWYDSVDDEIPEDIIPPKPKLVRGEHVKREEIEKKYPDLPALPIVTSWADATE